MALGASEVGNPRGAALPAGPAACPWSFIYKRGRKNNTKVAGPAPPRRPLRMPRARPRCGAGGGGAGGGGTRGRQRLATEARGEKG